jgi:SAM-dependent methyltransferase
MELAAFERLRCPACIGELRLESFSDQEHDGQTYVGSGVLLCEDCRVSYPIESGVPVMLRFSTAFHEWFAESQRERLASLGGYSMPSGTPRPGELAVQETFTDEWSLTTEDELSFVFTLEELVELNRKVWLRAITQLPPEEGPKTLLDVGCGVGMETMALREATGAEQLFGIDLNFALLSRRPEFRYRPDVHFVIASLFDLPFETQSFDLVYSEGVIHHTYSTSEAFEAITTRVRPGGHLFVWVYGLDDHLVPDGHRGMREHLLERLLRPLISRAPRRLRDAIFKALVAISHARRRRGGLAFGEKEGHGEQWTRQNTEHTLRDWLSPRYAHRHGFNEVIEWFESAEFRIVDVQSPSAYRALFDDPPFGVGMTGRRSDRADAGRAAGGREHATAA